ncbi:MAG: hypothetical protein LQ342_006870 [Letrouitia transgressa]|nr:MAG: hypothetical protein LQ342_006870 [Letrouitia transgressa]
MPLPAPLQHPLLAYLTTTLKLLTLYHLLTTTYPRIPTSSPTTGPSMLPTIHTAGDRVLVSRKYRRGKGIKVGDLVDFKSPLEEGVACRGDTSGLKEIT